MVVDEFTAFKIHWKFSLCGDMTMLYGKLIRDTVVWTQFYAFYDTELTFKRINLVLKLLDLPFSCLCPVLLLINLIAQGLHFFSQQFFCFCSLTEGGVEKGRWRREGGGGRGKTGTDIRN